MDSLTEYTRATALLTMRIYKANTETQKIAQNLENNCVQLDYIARMPVMINFMFRRWEHSCSIYFFCAAVTGSEFQPVIIIIMSNTMDNHTPVN
jgi:hypothetical protein